MYYSKKIAVFSIMMLLGLGSAGTIFAAGNITSPRQYSQFLNTDLDNNGTKDFINWSPTSGGATVTDAALTGNIWGDTVGWINLNPAGGGVTNTCSGILGGYAWGQNTGWINFAPTAAVGANKPKIDTTTGEITGTVWSQNYGWITLNSSNGTYAGLTTSWHGCTGTGSGTGTGGGSSGHITSSTTTPPVTPTPVIPSTPGVPGNPQVPTIPSSPGTTGTSGSNPVNPPSIPKTTPTQNAAPVIVGATTIPHFSIGTFIGDAFNKIDFENKKGFAWLAMILAIIGLLSSIPGLITRFGNLLLTFFFARKKRRGVVFDSHTKEPLDPAYVSVIDAVTGQEVSTAITDMEGRFGFVLKKGSYKIVVNKTNYQFPSIKLAGKTNDEVYDHLYFGEVFTVSDEEEVVTMNIPMDAVGTDWNQQEKRRMNVIKYFIENQKVWGILFDILFIIGFIVSIVTTYYYPVWWNVLMIVMYLIVALLQFFGYGSISVGKITKDGVPLPFAVVRVINVSLDREVAHKVTSEHGGYFILVPRANYYISIDQKNSDGSYTKIFTSPALRADHGMINRSFNL